MTRIFVSYSHVDHSDVEELVKRLRKVYGYDNVWMDDALTGGDIWWKEILDQIAACDIFLYMLSNESVNSPYCQAEYQEAYRLRKRIITAQIRDRTKLTDELAERQYVDMIDWKRNTDQLNDLHRALRKQEGLVRRRRSRYAGRTPNPGKINLDKEQAQRDDKHRDESSTLPRMTTQQPAASFRQRLAKKLGIREIWINVASGVTIFVIAALLTYAASSFLGKDDTSQTPTSPPAVTEDGSETPTQQEIADAATPPDAPVPTETPTPTATLTLTPNQTATDDAATAQAEQTLSVRQTTETEQAGQTVTSAAITQQAQETTEALTLTATWWTTTPDVTGSTVAKDTLDAEGTMTQTAFDQTATATFWTVIPSPSETSPPTNTPTVSPTTTSIPIIGRPPDVTLFVDSETLVIYLSGDLPLRIADLVLVVTVDGEEELHPLAGLSALAGLTELNPPACIRLEQFQARSPWPTDCARAPNDQIHVQELLRSDVFWVDSVLGNPRLITVRYGLYYEARCPAGQNTCELDFAYNGSWNPVAEEVNGVEMVLVPFGCFTMGSSDDQVADVVSELGGQPPWLTNEQPDHVICFDEPFWIDRFEVTNEQFEAWGGQAGRPSLITGANRPRERITWFEAQGYCELRGARLPTEAEWEYAARGPDSLIYPWGNEFVAENVIYTGNSNSLTADVGSRPGGVSWVGADDLGGNVNEWTHSVFAPYPYNTTDGRESDDDTTSTRVVRGGSFVDTTVNTRAARRFVNDPGDEFGSIGFRCARSYQ